MIFEVLPVKQVKSNENINIPEPFIKPPFLGLIYGGVRSGKSCLLINLVYRVYNKKIFDGGVIIFSPNINNDEIFESNFGSDSDIIKFTEDLNNIDMYVKGLVDIQQKKGKEKRKNILIIFDDIIGYIKQKSYIANFCTRYRQLKISLIFTTQAFRQIPIVIRSNCSFMILFRTYNKKEKDKIVEELSHIKNYESMYNDATQKQYSFLFVNLKDIELYECFNRCLFKWGDQFKKIENKKENKQEKENSDDKEK